MVIAFVLSYYFMLLVFFSHVATTEQTFQVRSYTYSSHVLIHKIEILSSSYILIMTLATEIII